PQLYKQLFMVAGMDRYFSLARCFRDEDLRADRQPEFTQIDIEMSFVEQDDVIDLAERLTAHIMFKVVGYSLKLPLPRMSYDEAMRRFGTDKPDTRIPFEIIDITDIVDGCGFGVFENAAKNGVVRVLPVPYIADKMSRKKIDQLTKLAQEWGAKGLATAKISENGFEGGVSKFWTDSFKEKLREKLGDKFHPNTILLFGADKPGIVSKVLGGMRTMLADEFDIVNRSEHSALFVVDFPLFEPDEDSERGITPSHHPFTMPAGSTVHVFFNVLAVMTFLPLEMFTHYLEHSAIFLQKIFAGVGGLKLISPLKIIVKPAVHLIIDIITSLSLGHTLTAVVSFVVAILLLFFALSRLVSIMKQLIIGKVERLLHGYLFANPIRSLLIGIVLTAIVQSSSIITSLVVPIVGAGILTVEQIFPYTIGANIGTTVTAIMASLITQNPAAVSTAFVHLLFNISGGIIWYGIPFLRKIPIALSKLLAGVAYKKRWVAILYVVITFYIAPLLLATIIEGG
ncbi:hypothetical protein DRQ26_06435, partial [bacterium]